MDNSTTYHVYRIVNFQNGKCYIGRSSGKTREWQHFYHLKNGTHHSSKLQRAFDKYGRVAFYFEVIENNIQATLISERESWWVNHFHAFEDGYNMTEGGETYSSFGKECVWNRVTYPSITGAAIANNISEATMFERLSKGYTSDSDMVRPLEEIAPKPCEWDGVEYASLSEAARANRTTVTTIRRWLEKGFKSPGDIPLGKRNPVIWNGIQYRSISVAAKANGVAVETMRHRVLKGMTCDDDVEANEQVTKSIQSFTKSKPCVFNGIQYPNITMAAKSIGVNRNTMSRYLKLGYANTDDIKL